MREIEVYFDQPIPLLKPVFKTQSLQTFFGKAPESLPKTCHTTQKGSDQEASFHLVSRFSFFKNISLFVEVFCEFFLNPRITIFETFLYDYLTQLTRVTKN